MLFDGRKYAREVEQRVKARVERLEHEPKIVSVLVGSDPASELYTRLKKEAAERVGIEFEIVKLENTSTQQLKNKVTEVGEQEDVDGVMVQMPIPGMTREEQVEVMRVIPLDKDVDGLRWEESAVMPATVRAILAIMQEIADRQIQNPKLQITNKSKIQNQNIETGEDFWGKKFVIVGTHGSVGKPLVHYLRERGVEKLVEVNSEVTDPARTILAGEVVISCVGREGLITPEMVSDIAIVIDVGAPKGDMTSEVYEKARVAVGVPGGVGPVTVASLMENAVEVANYEKE